jgi:hypothetical protein
MRTSLKLKYVLGVILGLWGIESVGHERLVHRAITANAAASALGNSSAYAGFINTISSDCDSTNAIKSMLLGSSVEDNDFPPIDVGGLRSYNHFYDPLNGEGLSDYPPDRHILTGTNSFAWATRRDCRGFDFNPISPLNPFVRNVNTTNRWSWQNARDYQWLGLTGTNRTDRQAALTNMFRAVGQVVHLLQDLSQPQHVRNEQHLDLFGSPWHSPIEIYGLKNVADLNYHHGMLSWKDCGFSKLEDFWDRGKYDGHDASALKADADGALADQLGLAEFSNGNFLGDRHRYADYYATDSIKYYPFPRKSGTNFKEVRMHPSSSTDFFTLKNRQQYTGIYYAKIKDGIPVTHHSRVAFLQTKYSDAPLVHGSTIRDDTVRSDYHNILIPKAVAYSAGLLDYFFRGTMSSAVIGYDSDSLQCTEQIVNTSGQDFGNGVFSVYADDENDVRTLLGQTNFSGILPNGGIMDMTFTNATWPTNKLLLVYKGTIGLTGTSASDPMDAGIAIAATPVNLDPWFGMFWDVTFEDDTDCTGNIGCPNIGLNSFDITRGSLTPSEKELTGTMTYTGPEMPSTFVFDQVSECLDGSATVTIKRNGTTIYSGTILAGQNGEDSFTVPASDHATVQIVVTLSVGYHCSRLIGQLFKN